MAYKLSKKDLINILSTLKKDYNVFAPILENNETVLKEFNGKDIFTGTGLPVNSLKDLVLPQRDCMLKYNWKKETGYTVDEIKTDDKNIIAFARPCDASALSVTDKIFLNNRVDNYYKEKRDKLTVIALACSTVCNTCFCMEMGEGPFGESSSDIIGVFKDGNFIFKSITDKGAELAKKLNGQAAEDTVLNEEKEKTVKSLNQERINIDELRKKAADKYEDGLWEELGEACLGCGVCTYLCPTCHCFDIQEEVKKNSGLRVRNWDSCQFALFTKEASGHNPRNTGKDRMKQRFLHKLQYIPLNNEDTGCVGCGRCVKSCPVNIDIREVIKRIME